jgi:gliding motility-associated-like protein
MKNKYLKHLLFVFISLSGGYFHANATHIVGGEIGYKCLGDNTFQIKLDVYRDCLNAAPNALFDDPASIGIFNREGILVMELLISPAFVSGGMVDDTLNYDESDPCLVSPPDVCVHTTTYLDTVQLDPIPGGYQIVYQRCCRNETITNIEDPIATGSTFDINLTEEAILICNSSPEINFWPPIFVCYGQPLRFDHSAIDIVDNVEDSLVYKFCQPKAGANLANPVPQPPNNPPYDTIPWISGSGIDFSIDNVLGLGEPLQIDPNTGVMTGTPELEGQFVVGLCVEEYNKETGNLLSITRRDFQYNVAQCGIVTARYDLPETTCDSLTYSFNNNSLESENFLWYFDWPSTEHSSNLARPSFTFEGPGAYQVALIAEPNTICSDTMIQTLIIHGTGADMDFRIDVYACEESPVIKLVDLSIDTADFIAYYWEVQYGSTILTSNEVSPFFPVPFGVLGNVTLTLTNEYGCISNLTKSFDSSIPNLVLNIPTELEACQGDSIELNPLTPEYLGYTYNWAPVELVSDPNERNPSFLAQEDVTFRVTISAGGGACFITDSIPVAVKNPPILDFDFLQSCKNSVQVIFDNLSQGADNYNWDFGIDSISSDISNVFEPLFTFPDTGTYAITLSLAQSEVCRDTLIKEIIVDQKTLLADFTVEYSSCSRDSVTVQLLDNSINSDDNTVMHEYRLSNGLVFNEPNPTFQLYQNEILDIQYTITDENNCSHQINKNEIAILLAQPANLQDSISICYGTETTIPITIDDHSFYKWSPSLGLSDSTIANPNFQPLISTEYNLSIFTVGADTCTSEEKIFFEVSTSANLLVIGAGLSCEDSTVVIASSDLPVTFEWYAAATNTSLGMGDSVSIGISGVDSFYLESTTLDNGCKEQLQFEVIGGPIDLQIPDTAAVCQGELFSLEVQNLDLKDSLTFNWQPSSLFISGTNTANPILKDSVGEQMVFLTTTSQYGCTRLDSIQTAVIDTNYSLSFTYEFECDGATINFTNTSSNALAYHWDFQEPGVISESRATNPTYTYSKPGTYVVTLSLGYDVTCGTRVFRDTINVAAVELAANFEKSIESCGNTIQTIKFDDTSINIFENNLTYQWNFSNGQSSDEANPSLEIFESGPVVATMTITSENNCSATFTDSFQVYIPQVFIPDTLVVCRGIPSFLNPQPDTNLVYSWSPSIGLDFTQRPNPQVTPLSTTTYTLTATHYGFDNCQFIQDVVVKVPEALNLATQGNAITCGEDAVLLATANPGTDIFWESTTGELINNGSDQIKVNPFREDIVTAVAIDTFGCIEKEDVLVIDNGVDYETDFPIGADTSFCQGDTLLINVINLDSLDALSYLWDPTEIVTLTGNPGNIKVGFSEDQQTLLGYISNQHGCIDTITLTSDITPLDPNLLDTIFTCPDIPFELGENADPTYVYNWGPIDLLSNNNIPNPTASVNSNTLFNVSIAYPGTPCQTDLEIWAIVYDSIRFTLLPDTTLCSEDSLQLYIQSNTLTDVRWSYQSNFSDFFALGDTVLGLAAPGQLIYAEVTDSNGCILTDVLSIGDGIIQATLQPQDTVLCEPPRDIEIQVINYKPNDSLIYFWEPVTEILSDPFVGPTAIVTAADSNNFMVFLENQFGCLDTINTSIQFVDLSIATVTADPPTIFPNDTSKLEVNGCVGCNYNWTPANTLSDNTIANPLAEPSTTTEYLVEIEKLGCNERLPITVQVRDDLPCGEPYIFIPNAFTPNGDGENDFFKVRSEIIIDLNMKIYNRWGEKVFESTQQEIGWDGTFRGKTLLPDVFGYVVEGTCYNQENFIKKGNLTLLKY